MRHDWVADLPTGFGNIFNSLCRCQFLVKFKDYTPTSLAEEQRAEREEKGIREGSSPRLAGGFWGNSIDDLVLLPAGLAPSPYTFLSRIKRWPEFA